MLDTTSKDDELINILDDYGCDVENALQASRPVKAIKTAQAKAIARIEQYGIQERMDELSKIPVIETKGVGYEVIVSHRMTRFQQLFTALKDKEED